MVRYGPKSSKVVLEPSYRYGFCHTFLVGKEIKTFLEAGVGLVSAHGLLEQKNYSFYDEKNY